MPSPGPQWLVDLKEMNDELQERDDELVLAGQLPLLRGETAEDVRARVAKRSGRPTLTLIRGARDDG